MIIVRWFATHPLALFVLGAFVALSGQSVTLLILGLVLVYCAFVVRFCGSRHVELDQELVQ